MSKSALGNSPKAQRKRAARKKAKQKKLILTGISVVVVAAIVVLVVLLTGSGAQDGTQTFSAGGQIVQFLGDGRFSASLAHNVRKSGTYTMTANDNGVTVDFNTNGLVELGWIEDDVLIIPEEWEDLCNHGRRLPRR